jgi:assimilatory nitrate reductase catalytic subunit
MLLAGGAAGVRRDYVCACFDVTREAIAALASKQAGLTVADVGAALKAGTNCGSCRPEIGRILDAGPSAPSCRGAKAIPAL